MAEVVASSFLGMVFDKLGRIAIEELQSLRGVGEELKKLKRTLSKIKDVLEDAEARQVKEKVIVGWLKDLKDVAYDIDDVLDVVVAEARKPNPLKRTHREMVSKLLTVPQSLQFQYKIAKKIKEIREKLDFISKEKDQYNLMIEGAAEHHPESKININRSRVTTSCVDEYQVVGRDTDKEAIIGFLLNKYNEQNLGVISIIGLGGVGKTTLAQLVYNDAEQVAKHFESKIWVHVSEKFIVENAITRILESLTGNKPEHFSNMDLLERKLLAEIEGKRFLLVLDDVWTEDDYEPWQKLKSLLKNGAKGSKVVVTTRSTRVARRMNSHELHQLDGLSKDDCWKLFEAEAFGTDGAGRNNMNLVAIGKEIVNKCGGLPLAAKALGSLMLFKTDESQWKAVRDSEIWTLYKDENKSEDDGKILPALMLSYNHLSSPLKQCFAFCSIFTKGKEIGIEMLVRLWVAEGFVVDSYRGRECVEHLISRSLFFLEQDCKSCVKMHDLVHDLARFVAGDECSIIDATIIGSNKKDILQNSRRASLILNEMTQSITQILSSGQRLRTFHSICNEDEYRFFSQGEEDICQEVINTVVSRVKLLRSLHLSRFAIKELPAMIEELVHLRYLNLSTTKLESLPKTIGNLVYLQHLDLSYTNLQTLPQTIGILHNLQTLSLFSCTKLKELPESIGGLENLLALDLHFCICIQMLPLTIGTLHNLKKLNLSKCRKLKELPESVGGMINLLTLNLSRCDSIQTLPPIIGTLNNLQTLDLFDCSGLEELPESIGDNLLILDLEDCSNLRELPTNIQSMRNLKRLDITGCDSLTSMPKGIGQLSQLLSLSTYAVGDGENSASLAELGTLINLKGYLHIKNLQNVKDVVEAAAANLREKQSLDKLILEWEFDAAWREREHESIDGFETERVAAMDAEQVQLLENILSSLQPHQNLHDLQIRSYLGKKLPTWMMDLSNLTNLTLEYFARCDNLKALEMLSCLEDLTLEAFLILKCLPRLGQLPRLRVLRLRKLPGVKCLGPELYGGAGAFPALESLELECMLGLEEWSENGNYEEVGNDFLPRLTTLALRDCPKLLALPSNFPAVRFLGECR